MGPNGLEYTKNLAGGEVYFLVSLWGVATLQNLQYFLSSILRSTFFLFFLLQ